MTVCLPVACIPNGICPDGAYGAPPFFEVWPSNADEAPEAEMMRYNFFEAWPSN